MFYVSSISEDGKIGITDTRDSVEEFYTDSQVCNFLNKDKIDIYGTSYYNYHSNCTVLRLNQKLSKKKLVKLIDDWRKLHNQWKGYVVEDYLAESRIGSVIRVEYESESSSGDICSYSLSMKRLSYDEWLIRDEGQDLQESGSSRLAAYHLEVACIYSKCKSLNIVY